MPEYITMNTTAPRTINFTTNGLYIKNTPDGKAVKIANNNTWYDVATCDRTNEIEGQLRAEIYCLRDRIENMETRLYEIISSHTSIDISEEEFLMLLRENK